jgi:hypothetical protein
MRLAAASKVPRSIEIQIVQNLHRVTEQVGNNHHDGFDSRPHLGAVRVLGKHLSFYNGGGNFQIHGIKASVFRIDIRD